MRLKTIRLHPFGRFRDESWDLSMPLAVVAGPNEMGKSTLRQAIFHAMFTPTDLTPAKLRNTMERWFPLPAGDHVAVCITFEHDGREWTLAKRWGFGKSTQLSSLGIAPIADPQAVATTLNEILGHSEATFRHVLFTGHTELEQTISSLLANTDKLRDVRDLLRVGSVAVGDVDEQGLRRALVARIKKLFDRWDDESSRPERKGGQEKGINDPWSKEVGEILKEWYAWQKLITEKSDILAIENEIDQKTGELTKLDDQDSSDKQLIDSFGNLRGPLFNRQAIEERVDNLGRQCELLQQVFTEWPKKIASLENWKEAKHDLQGQITRLKAERDTARQREEAVRFFKGYGYILEAKRELENANADLQCYSGPNSATITQITDLNKAIESANSQLKARTLAWRVEVAELETISVTRGLDPPELMEVSSDGVSGTAAGRVQFEAGGIKLIVDGGDDDVDGMLKRLRENSDRLHELLAPYGVESAAAALELANSQSKRMNVAQTKGSTFERLLQGKTFEQWQEEATAFNALPQTRDVLTIELEIQNLHGRLVTGETRVEADQIKHDDWKALYDDVNSLGKMLIDECSKLNKANAELDAAPTVPPRFSSAQHLIQELDDAQHRLNANIQPRNKIRERLADLYRELADRRSEDISEKAEAAERVFQRTRSTGRAYKRILETLDQVTAGGEDVLKDFAERVERVFSQISRGEAKVEFAGSLPANVHRGAVKLEPTRLSQGTNGALALALRLAMAEAYLQDTGGFIMLDDPLVHFDSDRAAEAAKIIRAFAERHQVIFFTCHVHHAAQLQS